MFCIEQLSKDPQFFLAVCITVVLSICVHELAHGIVAIWHGDRTPIETGHMTLNPAVHMGAMSLILLLVAGIAWGQMPITPSRLHDHVAQSAGFLWSRHPHLRWPRLYKRHTRESGSDSPTANLLQ